MIEREYRQQRLIPAFMEPRSTVVDPTGEQITVWSSTQVPHILRFFYAALLGINEAKVRVIAPDVGGGFGGKLETTPEEFITMVVARRLGKPVKYTETRSESLMAGHHGRDQWQKLTLSATKATAASPGSRWSCSPTSVSYVSLVGGGVPVLGAFMYNAIYKFPALQFSVTDGAHQQDLDRCLSRRRPAGGDVRHRQRMMDELAVEVGVDPLEIREKNWIKHEEFPFTTVVGLEYDTGNYEEATRMAKANFGYDDLRAEQKRRREEGDSVQLGIGVSTFTEMCGLAPEPGAREPRLRRRRLGARERANAGLPARSRCFTGSQRTRSGTRDGVQPDRGGPARCPLRGRRGAPRRHLRSPTVGWTPTGSRSLVVGGEALSGPPTR